VRGQLLRPARQAAGVLEPADGPLNDVAPAVRRPVKGRGRQPVAPAVADVIDSLGDAELHVMLLAPLPHRHGRVGPIAGEVPRPAAAPDVDRLQQRDGLGALLDLAGRQPKRGDRAVRVAGEVELRALTTTSR
jgi:hypothetical protein